MRYGFLLVEVLAELSSAHRVYRAVRAVCRLDEEGELELSERQRVLARRLERALRGFYEVGSESAVASLPLTRARRLVSELRGLVASSPIGACPTPRLYPYCNRYGRLFLP